jgi:hypothetical protein
MARLWLAMIIAGAGIAGAGVAGAGLIACGSGGSGDGDDTPPDGDAGIDAPIGPCDPRLPVNEQGCETGRRCAWIVDQVGPPPVGHTACVVDGTLPEGAPCEPSAAGQPDRCTTGYACAAGVCQDICSFDGAPTSACDAGESCARHADLFVTGDGVPFAGVCRPTCDPLTQTRDGGEPCGEGQGCYLITSATETVAVCARAGTVGHDEDLAGAVYANSCVPGAQPRRKSTADETPQCGGLCKPIDSTRAFFGSEGGLAPDSCAVRWGAAPADDGGRGESCRYWSGRESFTALSPYSNTIGWCFRHVAFQYDPEGDGTLDWGFPRCAALTTGNVQPPVTDPPHDDAAYFWCIAMPTARAPQIALPQVRAERIDD